MSMQPPLNPIQQYTPYQGQNDAPPPGPMIPTTYKPGAGQPQSPGYHGFTDANGNLLPGFGMGLHQVNGGGFNIDPSQFQISKFDDVNMDPTALNQIKEQAYNSGPSAWAQLLNNQQGIGQQNSLDTASRNAAGANAQALANLSRLGGLQGGAAERLATNSAKDTAFNQNAILRQGMTDKNSIALADASQKADLLKSIPGFQQSEANLKLQNQSAQTDVNKFNTGNQIDLNKYNSTMAEDLAKYNNTVAAQTDQFNIGNSIKDSQGQNAFNQGTYSDQMKAWAADQQAKATVDAGKH